MSALNRLTQIQKRELEKSLASMANGYHKTTAVKLEMEAQFDRPQGRDSDCYECEGTGFTYCMDCDDGSIDHDHYDCPEGCDTGRDTCPTCDGDYRQDCGECEGAGEQDEDTPDWSDPVVCEDFIKDAVPRSAREAIKYIKFYRDGSVDSECTVTVPIAKAAVLVHFIEAWVKLGQAIGNGMNIDRAGMHISILNDPDCFYTPGSNRDHNRLDRDMMKNFSLAMTPLLPALFFLASPSQQSRGLEYRTPRISGQKSSVYPAICHHDYTTIEYRVFETCYDNPLMLVDFLITIAKTLQFYKPEATDTSMKLGELGFKDGRGLDRFYYTTKHLTALDKGLKWLKPDYKTIEQLKKERNFELNRQKLYEQARQRQVEWRERYVHLKKSRHAERLAVYHKGMQRAYEKIAQGNTDLNPTEYAKRYLQDFLNDNGYLKGNMRDYLRQMAIEYNNDCRFKVSV